MSEKRFFCRRKIIIDGTNILKTEEIVDLLNSLSEENEQLKKLIEKKDILLKTRTEYIEDRIQSFNDFISYMDTFLYKSDVDPNDVKQDIMNILQKWEIKKRECCR